MVVPWGVRSVKLCRIFVEAKKSKSCLAAARTLTNILLRLQVWNMFTNSKQIQRAADCKKIAESPGENFQQTASLWAVPWVVCYSRSVFCRY